MVLYSFDKELYEKDLKQIAYEDGEKNKLISIVRKKLAKGQSAEQIAEAVRNDMNNGQYFSRQLSDSSDCVDEVWSRGMSFTIKQYR